jgi:hypothetical protein
VATTRQDLEEAGDVLDKLGLEARTLARTLRSRTRGGAVVGGGGGGCAQGGTAYGLSAALRGARAG